MPNVFLVSQSVSDEGFIPSETKTLEFTSYLFGIILLTSQRLLFRLKFSITNQSLREKTRLNILYNRLKV